MVDLVTCWEEILRTLANVEENRVFQPPLIILAHEKTLSSPPGLGTRLRQQAIVTAMIEQADIQTKHYYSGHHMPLVWGVRVDEGRNLGLVFIQLELKIETNEGLRQGRIRLVASKRHAREGWALETQGQLEGWRGAQRVLTPFLSTLPTTQHRVYNFIPADKVADIINELVREADRLHRIVHEALEG
jgi:hypothetical protein